MQNVVTPVKVNRLLELLRKANYDTDEIQFLEQGFTNGFDIGYDGPQQRQSTADNIPFTIGDKVDLWNKVMKEVKLKRVAGPFDNIPYSNFIQSPIGLVPKAGSDQARLIFHLSYNCKKDGLQLLNHFTPKEKCTVKYQDLDHAIHNYLKLSCLKSQSDTNCHQSKQDMQRRWKDRFNNHKDSRKTVFAGKTDLKSAFRILELSKDSWKWLIMKAEDPKQVNGSILLISVYHLGLPSVVPCFNAFLVPSVSSQKTNQLQVVKQQTI